MVFSWYIVAYLFVAGVAGGAFFVSFAACLWDGRCQSDASERAVAAVQPGFFLAPILAFLAIALLTLDLGNPDRLLSVFMSPFDSVIGAGAWMLAFFFVLTCALAVAALVSGELTRRFQMLLGIPAALCAVGVMCYTGILLSSMASVEFWYTPWLVALFVVSSLTTGLSAVIASSAILATPSSESNPLGLWRLCLVLSVIEAAVLFVFVWSRFHGGPVAAESDLLILAGSLALPFWIGVIAMGFLFPWALHALAPMTGSSVALFASSVGVLAGGFFLRYCIVGAGLFSPLVLSSIAVAA